MADTKKTSSFASAITAKTPAPKIKRTEVVIHLAYVTDESTCDTTHKKNYLMKKQHTYGPIFQHYCAQFNLDRADVIFTSGYGITIDSDSPKGSSVSGKHTHIYVRPKALEGNGYFRVEDFITKL